MSPIMMYDTMYDTWICKNWLISVCVCNVGFTQPMPIRMFRLYIYIYIWSNLALSIRAHWSILITDFISILCGWCNFYTIFHVEFFIILFVCSTFQSYLQRFADEKTIKRDCKKSHTVWGIFQVGSEK